MLDLDAGVHFHEIEMAGVIDQKFHRPGILITDGVCKFHTGVSHFLAQAIGH
jgi:hypothetical protein